MRGITLGAPLAQIKREGRTDYVFLQRVDFDRDEYPADGEVKVYAAGGEIVATKEAGPTSLTIREGVCLDTVCKGKGEISSRGERPGPL